MMPRFFNFFFFFLVAFSLFFSFTSALRKCRPQDTQVLSEIFGRTIDNCCRLPDTNCNHNTSWVDYLTIKNDVISGEISPAIGKMTHLHALILVRLPNVHGRIPAEMAKLTKLNYLRISHTNLSGPIPAWLGQLKYLDTLDLSNNQFTGSIPPSLGNLLELTLLNLEWNQLTGPIPESFGRLNLKDISLSHNQLSGSVPKSMGRIDFKKIDLNRNQLEGDPSHLFSNESKSLEQIDLSRNVFDFDFTNSVFPKETMIKMDLSHNMIRGSISMDLVNVVRLWQFNVSYNRLCGRIPQGGQVQAMPSDSFVHNPCLCGPPLSSSC